MEDCVREVHAHMHTCFHVLNDGSHKTFSAAFPLPPLIFTQTESLSGISFFFFFCLLLVFFPPTFPSVYPIPFLSEVKSKISLPLPPTLSLSLGGSSVPVWSFYLCNLHPLRQPSVPPYNTWFLLQPDPRKAAALCDEREREREMGRRAV